MDTAFLIFVIIWGGLNSIFVVYICISMCLELFNICTVTGCGCCKEEREKKKEEKRKKHLESISRDSGYISLCEYSNLEEKAQRKKDSEKCGDSHTTPFNFEKTVADTHFKTNAIAPPSMVPLRDKL